MLVRFLGPPPGAADLAFGRRFEGLQVGQFSVVHEAGRRTGEGVHLYQKSPAAPTARRRRSEAAVRFAQIGGFFDTARGDLGDAAGVRPATFDQRPSQVDTERHDALEILRCRQ